MAFINNILAPTDCSEISKEAMVNAIDLAKEYNAKLTVINITEGIGVVDKFSDPSHVYQDIADKVAEHYKKQFQEYWDAMDSMGVEVELVQESGEPFTCIVDYAKNHDQDIIVMGSHGLTGIMHVLMGSVAERVVRYSPVPVLVVKSKDIEF